MKTRISPYTMGQILGNKYMNLHETLLGMDMRGRKCAPITRGCYFVSSKDEIGRLMIANDQIARCIYSTGEIFCLFDDRIPLTSARLVHEYIHRLARHRIIMSHYISGLDYSLKWSLVNEGLTEYITMLVLGDEYDSVADPRNAYLPLLDPIKKIELSCGRKKILTAYLDGRRSLFRPFIKKTDGIYMFR